VNKRLNGILMAGLCAVLLLSVVAIAGAKTAYTTSKPVLSGTPHRDKPFTCSGVITPRSTSKSHATVKIILWMKKGNGYGVMNSYWAKVSKRPAGKPGSKYSCTITIPMKGDHGVQAVQYRGGKQVSRSSITYFTVQP
jgi:hypothetical protein